MRIQRERIILIFFLSCIGLSMNGCASWKSVPDIDTRGNAVFDASLTTTSFQEFTIKVHNKSGKNISVLWDKTLYIVPSGGTNGGFTFGIEYYWEDKDLIPAPTVISPGSSMERIIYPTANRYWGKRRWNWEYMSLGKNGVFITVDVDGKELTEKLLLEFIETKDPARTRNTD
jgi:hypothetical protein